MTELLPETEPSARQGREEVRRRVARRLAALAAGDGPHPYARYVNPDVGKLLHGLGLDVAFTRGTGVELYDTSGRCYLDFAGAYGALPFGHNPPEIWAAIKEVETSQEPSLVQPSLLDAAGQLAADLLAVAPAGLTKAWFCNSGAEAVEAAIKLVRAATGRSTIVSTTNAFHGKTLGALSATGRARYQGPFGAPAAGFVHLPFGDTGALERLFAASGPTIAGFIVEPIQGEGGIVAAPPGYLRRARELCDRAGALLVIDEVQTGLGRTGRLFACEDDGVVPDVMPLAKALGGGVVPIGAVLYSDAAHSEDFALRHTSTFGGNAFCARVGRRSLELLLADDGLLVRAARLRGQQLASGLRELAQRHQRVVKDVRGRGLLLGVEIASDPAGYPEQGLFRSLAAQDGLAAFLCSYLLREEGIRLAPTYFAGSVLRVEPPLTVTAHQCDRFLTALDRGLGLISTGDSARFFAHLDGGAHQPGAAAVVARHPRRETTDVLPRPHEPRWAFIAHPTDDESYRCFDPALGLPGPRVRALFDRMNQCRNLDGPAAMFVGACRLQTDNGESSFGEIYALPRSARDLLDMPVREAVDLVQTAVDQAVEAGAQVVGLGAYTSIVTRNGEALRDAGVPVTTGNAYTAAAAADGVRAAAAAQGVDLGVATCTVLGAAGSIGRVTTLVLAEDVGSLVLVGNPAHPERSLRLLREVATAVAAHLLERSPGPERAGALARRVGELAGAGLTAEGIASTLRREGLIELTVDSGPAVAAAEVVLAATSTPDQLIDAELPRAAAVICDVSQPPNISPDLRARRPDLLVVDGGLVRLPGGRDLGVDLGVPSGVTYACAAETMIIAHRLADPVVSRGARLDVDLVRTLRDEGPRLGFRLHVPGRAGTPHQASGRG